MKRHKQDPLLALAELCGVELSYIDSEGHVQTASEQALLGILRGLGWDLHHPADAEHAIATHQEKLWQQVLEPFQVMWDGVGNFVVRQPTNREESPYSWTLTCDNGTTISDHGVFQNLPFVTSADLGLGRYIARHIVIQEALPWGYAELELHLDHQIYRAKVAIAPSQAYTPDAAPQATNSPEKRRWGVFVPLYALHRQERPGIGHLGDLEALTTWVAQQGGEMVGILPILASYLDEPFAPGPYAPVSRLFWNELFLDLERIPEWKDCKKAQKVAASQTPGSSIDWVDYRGEMAAKRTVLEEMLSYLWKQSPERKQALESFADKHPEAAQYAAFRAVTEKRREPWPLWPDHLKSGDFKKNSYDVQSYRYHLYVQWNLQQQLEHLSQHSRKTGLGLYLDLALGVHAHGYDTWRYRHLFARNVATGAPPDPLFRGGQNWGFPPLHPDNILEDQYHYVIESIRNHTQYAGVLRIDHVMGLHRLYWIPDGMGAKEGVYVHYRPEHFYAILSIESHRNKTILIGEDLGTVQPAVRQQMHKHRLHRMHVMPFATETPKPPSKSIASLNTHDMPLFAAVWTGTDIQDRVQLGFITQEQAQQEHQERAWTCENTVRYLQEQGWLSERPHPVYPATPAGIEQVFQASLHLLASSESRFLMITLEDLWQENRSQNVPGTSDDKNPNWRGKTRYNLEEIMSSSAWAGVLQQVNDIRHQPVSVSLCEPKETVPTEPWLSLAPQKSTTWGELDDYYFAEGTHDRLYDKLGAHREVWAGQPGVRFRVWAPHASHVSVIGEFNQWNPTSSPCYRIGKSGVWEGFVAGALIGQLYKYSVVGPHGDTKHKFDPVGFAHEEPPKTASITWELGYEWKDREWMENRGKYHSLQSPISIYEVHLGSWMRDPKQPERILSFRELANRLADYAVEMGFTHVELMPVMEHPFFGSWGYQSIGYFAPSRRYGTPQDLMYLIDTLHQRKIGVILDWVPSHFPRDDYALAYFDGTATYEYADPRKGFHTDWTSNIFDYGRGPVQSFLISSAMFWLEYFHADGLRVDGVASILYLDYSRKSGEWIPNKYGGRENLEAVELIRRLNQRVYRRFPEVQTYAEESTSWPKVSRPTYEDGLGFGLKWDMGWMHDTLHYLQRDPIHRKFHHNELTFRMLYAFHENFVLALSHDEVVHGKGSLLDKMPGDPWRKLAQLRLLYGYMFGMPGKKLLFMGQEFAMSREWNHDTSIDWHLLEYETHRGVQRWVADLNRLYRKYPALHTGDNHHTGFTWTTVDDADNSIYGWLRNPVESGSVPVLVYCNFTPVPRYGYRVGVAQAGSWRELANSDALLYGGSGEGNLGRVETHDIPYQGHAQSLELTLPPFGVVFFCPENHKL